MDTPQVVMRVRRCTDPELHEISRRTGIPHPTLAKIRYGVTTNPRGMTVDALRSYFLRQERAAA